MILLVNICKEKLHFYEFVRPIEDILIRNKIKCFIRYYTCVIKKDLEKADKIIICGTSLRDNEFLNNIKDFNWIKNYKKPILGICGGSHVIGLSLGKKLKKQKEIGLKKIKFKGEFLGIGGERNVYHLHEFYTLPEVFKEKNLYATLFHPEVRNKEIIVNFCKL